MTASGWCSCHFDLTWIPFPPQISQWIRLPIPSSLLFHFLRPSLGHSFTMWLIFSSALLHILHFVCSCHLSILPLITLVRMAWSWAANIKLPVSQFRVQFPNHCHLSQFPTSLIYRTNWLCNIFPFQEIVLSFFFCFLASIAVYRIGSIKSIFTDLQAVSKRSLDFFT